MSQTLWFWGLDTKTKHEFHMQIMFTEQSKYRTLHKHKKISQSLRVLGLNMMTAK